ncbi:MAG TPA: metallophosphoesterase [Herpetosiphonaceae bacterium]
MLSYRPLLRSALICVLLAATLLAHLAQAETSPHSVPPKQPVAQIYIPFIANLRTTRFAVIGDYGTGSPGEQAVAALVKGWQPDFIATTGDNNYPSGEAATIDANIGAYYHEFIAPYYGTYGPGGTINRFFPTLGNHDWASGAGPYFDYFTLPGNERYYHLTWDSVQLFAIDSDPNEPDGVSSTSAQAMWLQNALATSSACWKIVYMHMPPYSSGAHGSTPWMQWPFQAWGADAVLAGHDHTYERIVRDGLPYFVNGLGGHVAYPFGEPIAGSEVRFNADVGAMLVEADREKIVFSFSTHTGALVDSYRLNKACR